ncbi:hypothetical protein [Sorangium sp. So ce131]|uniref:hypothetical protein n=1 Tax=Sorangium sp. So ce131 TaxID=3133282 RepID=UPI003F61B2B8
MRNSLLLPPVCALGIALAPAEARAHTPSWTGLAEELAEALAEMNFHSQLQVGVAAMLASGLRPGGMELRGTVNVHGFGASVGARYEPYPSGVGVLASLGLELRPLALAEINFFRALDPYVWVGGEIGGGSRGFRLAQDVGLGLDIGLFSRVDSNRENLHPALTLRYQYRAVQTPDDLPSHLLHIGGALRIVE